MDVGHYWNSIERVRRFEDLVKIGARNSTIVKLIPELQANPRTLRSKIGEVRARMGITDTLSRGKELSLNSSRFMKTLSERYHASVLLGLASRVGLVDAVSQGTESYTDHLIQIYNFYLQLNNHDSDVGGLIQFNEFVELIAAMRTENFLQMECVHCSAMYMMRKHAKGQSKLCPFCVLHEHVPYSQTATARAIAKANG